jgi:predicted DCC family thiol-disulfide oxidoreductase YuxK
MAGLTLLYDEDCGFCTRIAAWVARRPGIGAEPIGSAAGSVFLRDLTPEQRYAAFHVVDTQGRRSSGGAAVPVLLDELPAGVLLATACRWFPALTERVYQLIARNRASLSRLTRL